MKRKIEKIYELISRIPVNGDYVDVMAAVRADLRIVHNQMIEQEKHKNKQPIEQQAEAQTVEENA